MAEGEEDAVVGTVVVEGEGEDTWVEEAAAMDEEEVVTVSEEAVVTVSEEGGDTEGNEKWDSFIMKST